MYICGCPSCDGCVTATEIALRVFYMVGQLERGQDLVLIVCVRAVDDIWYSDKTRLLQDEW